MSGFTYSFSTHYAQRVVGRGKLPVMHIRQTETTREGGHRYPAQKTLCGVISGPLVGSSHTPNCRKCIAQLRKIERTGYEGRNSASRAVAAAEYAGRAGL